MPSFTQSTVRRALRLVSIERPIPARSAALSQLLAAPPTSFVFQDPRVKVGGAALSLPHEAVPAGTSTCSHKQALSKLQAISWTYPPELSNRHPCKQLPARWRPAPMDSSLQTPVKCRVKHHRACWPAGSSPCFTYLWNNLTQGPQPHSTPRPANPKTPSATLPPHPALPIPAAPPHYTQLQTKLSIMRNRTETNFDAHNSSRLRTLAAAAQHASSPAPHLSQVHHRQAAPARHHLQSAAGNPLAQRAIRLAHSW